MSASRPPPAPRALYLIVRLAARRWRARTFAGGWRRKRGTSSAAAQSGAKARTGLGMRLLIGGATLLLIMTAVLQTRLLVHQLINTHDSALAVDFRGFAAVSHADVVERSDSKLTGRLTGEPLRDALRRGARDASAADVELWARHYEERGLAGFRSSWSDASWPQEPEPVQGVTRMVGLLLGLILLLALANGVSTQGHDLGASAWDLEWYWTLPISGRAALGARLLQHALLSPWLWIPAPSLLFNVLHLAGRPWPLAALLALLATAGLAAWLGAGHLLIETWLRTRVRHPKNFQSVCVVIGMVIFFGLMALPTRPRTPDFLLAVGHALPSAATPWSLPALWSGAPGAALASAAAFLVGAIVAAWGALALASRSVRGGLQTSASGHPGTRGPAQWGGSSARWPRFAWLRGAVGKDLRLLTRDRALFVQSLVVPLIIVGFNLTMNDGIARSVAADGSKLATFALSVGCYVLMFCAMPILAVEGKALWMLYALPQTLDRVLAAKVRMWAAISLLYTLAVMAVGSAFIRAPTPSDLARMALALVSVPAFAFIAAGIGAMATDPLAVEIRRRVKPSASYLYFMVVGGAGFALASGTLWQACVQTALVGLLALAIWQKLRDRVPYLLDPVARPPAEVSVSDGIVAVMAFSLAQVALVLLMDGMPIPTGLRLLISFAGAGFLASGGAFLALRRVGVARLRETLGLQTAPLSAWLRASGVGAAAGCAAGLLGLLWLLIVARVPQLREWRDQTIPLHDVSWGAFLLLAVVAAPLCEEFLFRGLLFRGMQRTLGGARAILGSAAIFTAVHPPLGAPAIFGLALAAAWVFQRQSLLIAPIAAHAVYNAIVILAPAALPQWFI